MKKLIKTILFCGFISLCGCFNKGYRAGYAAGNDDGKASAQAICEQEKKLAYDKGVGDGRLATTQEYIKLQNEVVKEVRVSIIRNFYIETEQGNEIINAFMEAENGNNLPIINQTEIIGNLIIKAIEKSFAEKKIKLTNEQKKRFFEVLKAQKYNISSELFKDYLGQIKNTNLNILMKTTDATSTVYSIRGNLIAQTILSNICSFTPLVLASMGVAEPYNAWAGLLLKRPCESFLMNLAGEIGKNIQNAAVIKDIEITKQNIRLLGRSLAELSTASYEFPVTETRILRPKFYGTGGSLMIKYKATVKAGVDFRNSFIIRRDDKLKTLYITIPKAKLLNIDLRQDSISLKDGEVADLRHIDLINIHVDARNKGWGIATQSDLKERAAVNAQKFITLIFKPLVENPYTPYKIIFEKI